MTHFRLYPVLMFCIAFTLTACSDEGDRSSTALPEPVAEAADGGQRVGTVMETINSGGYTYVQVASEEETFWAAAPEFPVEVGKTVLVPAGMPMENFHSSTLDRDFDVVYFVNNVFVEGEGGMAGAAPAMQGARPDMEAMRAQMPDGHPDVRAGGQDLPPIEAGAIALADGGMRIADLYAESADLSGKTVTVRGQVVKFNPGIMGTNWLHIRDGSGEGPTSDLTVTTDQSASVGETVTVTGVLATDKDFGFGYAYDVLVEGAQVAVE